MTPTDGLTLADRMAFETWLCARVDAAKAEWKAAPRRVDVGRSNDAPGPDGTLLRQQGLAQLIEANRLLGKFRDALRDLQDMAARGTYRPELLEEWRQVRPVERMPFQSATRADERKKA